MVALSKLLVGALIQSAYGRQELEKPKETSAALTGSTTTIEQKACNGEEYGHLTIRWSEKTNCTITGVAAKASSLYIQANCTEPKHGNTFGVDGNELKLDGNITVFSVNANDDIIVGEKTPYKNGSCINVVLPNKTFYQILIPEFEPEVLYDKNKAASVASLVTPDGKTVEKSALFGTNGGEWDIFDLVGFVAAGVLVCCLGLALYGCWSKKKKQDAEQRQTKYVAQNSNPSGRTGTQRRRR